MRLGNDESISFNMLLGSFHICSGSCLNWLTFGTPEQAPLGRQLHAKVRCDVLVALGSRGGGGGAA